MVVFDIISILGFTVTVVVGIAVSEILRLSGYQSQVNNNLLAKFSRRNQNQELNIISRKQFREASNN